MTASGNDRKENGDESFVEEPRRFVHRLLLQMGGVAVFEARAEEFEPVEERRRALFAIPGSGPARRQSRRRIVVTAIGIALVAGNAFLVRDIVVTTGNAERLPSEKQKAQSQIVERQHDLLRTQGALDAATRELDQATRARDRARHSDASTRAQAVSRQRQVAAAQARVDALHQQVSALSRCVSALQGPLNDTSRGANISCGVAP